MSVLDGGSDLSDLDSPPTTPGCAVTPGATTVHSPFNFNAGGPSRSPSSSNKKVSGADKSRRDSRKETDSKGPRKSIENKGNAGKKGPKAGKSNKWNYDSDEDQSSSLVKSTPSNVVEGGSGDDAMPTSFPEKHSKVGQRPIPVKKTSMKGWAMVPIEETLPQDIPLVEGKRSRRPTTQYSNPAKQSKGSRATPMSDSNLPEESPEAISTSTSETNVKPDGSKSTLKVKLHLKRKEPHESVSDHPDTTGYDREDSKMMALSKSASPDNEDEDGVQTSRRRKRAKGQVNLEDDDGNRESGEEAEGSRRQNEKGRDQQRKKKKKKEKEAGKVRKVPEIDDDEDASDEYREAKLSEDEVMSEDAEDEAFEPSPKNKSVASKEAESSMPRLKRKSETGSLGDDRIVAATPRSSTGIRSAKPTVASVVSAYKKPVTIATTPAKPPLPKATIRKVPSMNLFDNLMGFGSGSKESTPGKSPAVRPRPSAGSGVNTPQANSPMVRPPGLSRKLEEDSAAIRTASPTRTSSISARPSLLTSNGRGHPQPVVSKGADGEHVTAAEMAKRREIELYANAHPKGLFDMLEDAETMSQFEEETRLLLPIDYLMAKTKMYRPGRTEGLSKLVERIKETNRKQSQPEIVE